MRRERNKKMTVAQWKLLQSVRRGPADMSIGDWWRRHSAASKKRLMLKAGAVALGVVVATIVVARLTWGTSGPGLITPVAFFGLFVAAVVLFGLAVVSSDELVDELESAHAPRVRKRGVVPRFLRDAFAKFGSTALATLLRIGAAVRYQLASVRVTMGWRAFVEALSGVPPDGMWPTDAGPLGRPLPPRSPSEDDTEPRLRRSSRPSGRGALHRLEQLYRGRRPRRRSVPRRRAATPERPRRDPISARRTTSRATGAPRRRTTSARRR